MTKSLQEMFGLIAKSVRGAIEDIDTILENNRFTDQERATLEGAQALLASGASRLEEIL